MRLCVWSQDGQVGTGDRNVLEDWKIVAASSCEHIVLSLALPMQDASLRVTLIGPWARIHSMGAPAASVPRPRGAGARPSARTWGPSTQSSRFNPPRRLQLWPLASSTIDRCPAPRDPTVPAPVSSYSYSHRAPWVGRWLVDWYAHPGSGSRHGSSVHGTIASCRDANINLSTCN